jgi:hypothetical protein
MIELKYQLHSHIPGVTVKLTPNPLNAKIEMTETAKREFALTVWTQDLVENYFLTGRFYMNPRCGKNVDGVYVPDEPNIKEAISWTESGEKIWYEGWYGEKNGEEDTTTLPRVDRLLQNKLVAAYLSELDSEHCGDCIAVACTCCRCYAEEILGINTLPVGKSIARILQELYFEEHAAQEEKDARRKRQEEFKLKYPSSNKMTPEQLAHWEPIWVENKRIALQYYEEHKRLYRLQEGL